MRKCAGLAGNRELCVQALNKAFQRIEAPMHARPVGIERNVYYRVKSENPADIFMGAFFAPARHKQKRGNGR